jgi:hypothetical protein
MKLVIMNNHEPPMHLGFLLLRCCTAKTTPSRLSTCIRDQNSGSPEPSSLAILQRKRANKIFGKRSSRLLTLFFKFFITASLPLRQTRAESRHLQRELCQANCRLHPIVVFIRSSSSRNRKSRMISPIKSCLTY